MVPAAAITIHKPQGATFDHVVFDYDTSQKNQLLLCGDESTDRLERSSYRDSRGEFQFYEGAGSMGPILKEVRYQYSKLV